MMGSEKNLIVLVDTGAEANLIRRNVLSESHMFLAAEPLNFVTANGNPLEGGKRCANLQLTFQQKVEGQFLSPTKIFSGQFYEADIGVDAIISHPWMAENHIGVFPHP